nr:MAG TPA: hypothetical protein [Caudoviricetes sp.]
MAIIKKDGNFMGLPMNIQRGNPIPLDDSSVYYSKATMETYAKSGVTAYVGQIVTLVDETNKTCEAYMISNEAGTLVKLASTTASGDLASDVATLQGQVADLISKVGKAAEGEVSATGLYALIDEVKTLAEGKVASVGATDKSIIVGGTVTAPTVKVAISAAEDNALSLADDGLKVVVPEVTHPEYTVVKKADSGDYAAVYQLTKDGTAVGADINIPKDMMVKSGSVQTYEAGSLPGGVTEPGTYIVLVLNDAAETKLYINVGNLIEYVTSGSAEGDMVFINIDPQTHKVTATITDGTVTEAKLHADVKAKLAKAVSAIQEVKAGTANGTIAVDGADVAVTGLADAAYATVASLNEAAQGKVDTAKGELLGAEADDSTKETIRGARKLAEDSAASALSDAKTYVGTEIGKLDVEDTAVAKQFVSAVSETDGKITVERRALVANDVPELGISKISGLQAAIDAKQDTVTFDGEYSATNKAATVNTVNSAVAAVVSNGADKATDDTIKGAKLYADGKSSDALTAAKAYADGLVTGDTGVTARVEALEGKVDVAKVSTAIATAKDEAIAAAATDASTKDAALKTAILGEEGYTQTVKSAYELAASKATMTEVEAKDYATKTEAQGYADAKDTAIAEAKKAGTDAMAKIGTIPEGATATTAIGYVDEKIAAIPAQTDYTVTCNATTPEGYAKRYTLSQCGSQIVSIDIPSDMVVSSGKVVENPAGQTAGTYIELTLANATKDKIYINVGDLIEYVTGAEAADGIITTAVDSNHVLTATIGDGKITKAKLADAVQTSLGKADTALQAVALEPYAKTADVAAGYVAKNGTDRLMTADEGTKLAGIAAGAQVNVIEAVKVGGVALDIADKAVNIESISTDLLAQGTMTLVLKGGNAATLAQG